MKSPSTPPRQQRFLGHLCITLCLVLSSITSLVAQPDYTNAYRVSTFAGKAQWGSTDTTATVPKFRAPQGVAVDATGNVYVADTDNNKIRKVTPAGVVTTIGSGFSRPRGVAVDSSGNVYVADTGNHAIRKISANGGLSILHWSQPSPIVAPVAVAVGPDGSVYIVDSGNRRICVITPEGDGSVLIGGLFTSILNQPTGVAVDGHGIVYVADHGYSTVIKVRQDGKPSGLGGSGVPEPQGIAVDVSGNVFVSTMGGNILKITDEGVVTTVSNSSLYMPAGLAMDSNGTLFIAEEGEQRIVKMTQAGVVSVVAGSSPSGDADSFSTPSFYSPSGIAKDGSGNMYVADSNNEKIRKIDSNGMVSTFAGSTTFGNKNGTGTAARFSNPLGIATDSDGNVYVADCNNHSIRKITPDAVVTTLAGTGTNGSANGNGTAAGFHNPSGVAVDAGGNVFVADSGNHKIRKITPAGDVTTFAGSGTPGGNDGSGISASFSNPIGLAIDANDTLYVADMGNHKIRKITANGAVTTFAGNGTIGKTDATATTSSFSQPWGVAVDAGGNVYVTDAHHGNLRKITAGGLVRTLAGDEFSNGESAVRDPQFNYSSGTGRGADVQIPAGVVASNDGSVYFADRSLNQIRKAVAAATQTISFIAPVGEKFGNDSFTPDAAASSGLPVSFRIISGPARVSGGEIELTGAGVVILRASQAGNADFAAAPSVQKSFVVARATQSISFGPVEGKIFEGKGSPFKVSATASSEWPVTFSVVSGPATISGSRVKLTGAGKVVIRASQLGNAYFLPAPPVDRSFIVGPSSVSTLSRLLLKSVRLNHVFNPGRINYTARVNAQVSFTTVTPFLTSKVSSVRVNGEEVSPGTASKRIPLKEGKNQIFIMVMAQNTLKKTYIIVITREKLLVKPRATAAALIAELSDEKSPLEATKSTHYVDGLKYLTLTVDRSKHPLAQPTVEVSSNLMDWCSGEHHTTVLQDTTDRYQVRDNLPVEPSEKRYIRVKQ